MSKLYVHYGATKLDTQRVLASHNRQFHLGSKPDYGLWASPVEAAYGWKDWCKDNDFRECDENNAFYFELEKNAKVLEIRDEIDIKPYYEDNCMSSMFKLSIYNGGDEISQPFRTSVIGAIDYAKIVNDGYDAVELFQSQNWHLHDTVFNSWDCDSIVILNPYIIVVKEGLQND